MLLKVLHWKKHWDHYLVCYLVWNWAEHSGMSWVILLMEMMMVMNSVPCFLLDCHLEPMTESNFRMELHCANLMAHRMSKNWVYLKAIHLVCWRTHHLEINLANWKDDWMAHRMTYVLLWD